MATLDNDGLMHAGKAYNKSSTAPMADITAHNGYDGHLPDLSAINTNSAYMKRNLIAVVLDTPKGFDSLPDSAVWHQTCKAIIETQSKTITGITSTLAIEWSQNSVGGAGEVQSDVANVTRAPSTPTHTCLEKPGKPITKFWNGWILNLLGDPETNVPRVMTYSDNKKNKNFNLLPNMLGCTVLYFEPDHTFNHVVEAWLCTDMKPLNGVTVEGSRDIAAGATNLEHSLEFTSIQQVGINVNALAQAELDKMNLADISPELRPAMATGRSPAVADSDVGYAEGIKAASETFVRP